MEIPPQDTAFSRLGLNDAIAFAVAAPIAVNISNMEILPTLQVAAGLTTVKPEAV